MSRNIRWLRTAVYEINEEIQNDKWLNKALKLESKLNEVLNHPMIDFQRYFEIKCMYKWLLKWEEKILDRLKEKCKCKVKYHPQLGAYIYWQLKQNALLYLDLDAVEN